MRKGDAAEWILSLTTTPERAASTAGDLLQESATRGTAWFWSSLLRTAASMVWHVWADNPLRMAGLAVGACLFNGVLFVISIAAIVVGGEVAVEGTKRLGLDVNVLVLASAATKWAGLAAQVLIGRWLARHAPAQELAACTAFLCLDTALWTLFAASVHWIDPRSLELADMVMAPFLNVFGGLFLLIGVDQIRERALKARAISR